MSWILFSLQILASSDYGNKGDQDKTIIMLRSVWHLASVWSELVGLEIQKYPFP